VFALVVLVLVTLAQPHGSLTERLNYVGKAVCGRLPEHSLLFAGQYLPHCARCTGTYLSALLTYIVLGILGRGRRSRLPDVRLMMALLAFIGLWAMDGINSYVSLIQEQPFLYEPSNLIRLGTGLLQGMALTVIVRPVVASAFWADTEDKPILRGWAELALLALVAGIAGYGAQSEVAWLYDPLAIASIAGQLLLLTLVNGLIACLVLRRDGLGTGWREVLPFWLIGLAAAMGEITLINLGRAALGNWLGVPL
jgi:uncharacterized membrane protein